MQNNTITVSAIKAFDDNYIWLIDNGKAALVVDPGDATPVIAELAARQLELVGILNTHHHFDHVGGIAELKQSWPTLVVYGPPTQALSKVHCQQGNRIEALPGFELEIIEIPGHTLDHIAFYHHADKPLLFCGDTLFAGGCGRLFEGSPQQMHDSLDRLSQYPNNTLVYCAHEYTLANLHFAMAVEPNNEQLKQRFEVDTAKRQRQQATVPSTLEIEIATNPFLRCTSASVQATARQRNGQDNNSEVEVFAAIRQWKDSF